MKIRCLFAIFAFFVPTVLDGQSLTLSELKGPVARACKTAPATTIAEFWKQLDACNQKPAPSEFTPMSMAEPSGNAIISPSTEGALQFTTSFDIAKGLKPSWGTGAIPALYQKDRSEGAFRFTCAGDGPLKYDDPLLYHGQSGKSHLHLFWGNNSASAFTTSATLAASGSSNCNNSTFALNRSLYWMPAMINDQGQVVRADLIDVYYKRMTSRSAACTPGSKVVEGICVGLPNDIRFIFGWNMLAPSAKVVGASWYCSKGDSKHYDNLDEVFNSGCTVGATLIADTIAPSCWDGKNLDSADHRSHMSYPSYGNWGYRKCDAAHPYLIPTEENKAFWTVTDDMIGTRADGTHFSRVRLSSDAMIPSAKPGQTLHADYIEKWDGRAKALWLANCIEKALSCSGGDLGNGLQLIGASQPSYGWVNPNARVAIPAR